MSKKEKQEQEAKAREEQRRVEAERKQGVADLEQHNRAQAAKSDEERAADEDLARLQQEEAAAAERERAEAEQQAVKEAEAEVAAELARLQQEEAVDAEGGPDETEVALPADLRVFAPRSVLYTKSGVAVELLIDTPVVGEGFASEQHFASVLVQDAELFGLNANRLRLVYNPMNGTPAPLSEQHLSLEEMTESEQAIFAPPPPRPSRK